MNKYRNKPTMIDNKWFASKKEAKRYQELCILQKAGEITNLHTQVRIPISINGMHICEYRADFTYKDAKGNIVIEDTKGIRTPLYNIKKKLIHAIYNFKIKEV